MSEAPIEGWIAACTIDELPPGEVLRVDLDRPIAVYNVEGEFYATDDTCTHEVSSLADGYVDDDVVECAFHFAKFCIRTGKALSYPATEPLAVYRVQVMADKVYVDPFPRSGTETQPRSGTETNRGAEPRPNRGAEPRPSRTPVRSADSPCHPS